MVKTTRAQRVTLAHYWRRQEAGDRPMGETYRQFRRRVLPAWGYIGIAWCGMYIGIEPDGYGHS